MILILEIEYLSGVSYAATGPGGQVPDWPPQPDRIFSALVATWSLHGKEEEEAEALQWLERLATPRILASQADPRTSVIVFVPPNDPRSDKQKSATGVLPAMRSRQPRRFPAARPRERVIRLVWADAEPGEATFRCLQRLANDTAYVGHSASLTRCRFLLDNNASGISEGQLPERRVYSGRFVELRRSYAIFESSAGKRGRPLPGAPVATKSEARRRAATVFADRWLLLEHIDGDMPDLRACAVVARTIRNALMSGYQRIGLGNDIPQVISGHAVDGSPAQSPHLAIVPLPFAGFPHADGHVMGFALVPPRDSSILDDEELRRVLRMIAPMDEQRGRRVLTIKTKEGTSPDQAFSILLSPTFEAPRRSLRPALYCSSATLFATVTPIALDRHLKMTGEQRQIEIEAQVALACRNIGLPDPEQVVADKHSAFEGAPSAYPSGRSPDWMRWRLPQSLISRQLTHAVIRFPAPVEGPVIIGAGRFTGLGLCRPIDRVEP